MDIHNSDFILILNLEDIHGDKLRVKDCAEFSVRVWTTDRTHFLSFKPRDIISDDYNDRIAIDKIQMECLDSGVLIYEYDYAKWNADFTHTDEKYNKVKTVVTDIYWANVVNTENPCNILNYRTIEDIKDQIEAVRNDHIKDMAQFKVEMEDKYINSTVELSDKLDKEIKRSNEVDVEMFNLIKTNKSESVETTNDLSEKLDAEIKRSNDVDVEIFNFIKGNKDENKEQLDSTNDKLDAEIARSSQKDADIENALNNEITRANNAETIIDTKLEGEIERAKTAEGAIRDAVENERDRATTKETLLNDTISSEIERAKAVEKDIATSLQMLKTSVMEEKQRSTDKDIEHTNAVNQLSSQFDTEIARAKDREEHINDDLHSEIERAKAEEARIENLINSNNDKDNELKEIVNSEIERAKVAEKSNADAIANEIARATEKDDELLNIITNNSTAITDEIERAKSVESEIKDTLKDTVKYSPIDATRKTILLDNYDSISGFGTNGNGYNLAMVSKWNVADFGSNGIHLNLNSVDRPTLNDDKEIALKEDIDNAKNEIKEYVETNLTNADNNITELSEKLDKEIKRSTDIDNANEAELIIMNAKIDVNTSNISSEIERAKAVEKDITESLQRLKTTVLNNDANITDTLKSYATKEEVDERIGNVIGTAPEALDTLGEIADALNGNGDAIAAINGVLTGKANKEEVATAIDNEVNRAKAAEKLNADAIAVINGGEEVIGSLAHTLSDAKHYTDDQLKGINAETNIAIANMATKNELAELDGKLTAHTSYAETKYATKDEVSTSLEDYYNKTESDNKYQPIGEYLTEHQSLEDYYTKDEVDTVISNVSVDLSDYAKTAETTAIKDENGNIITEMIIDNSDADDSVEVYTKEQCDERFARFWSGTEAEYEALETKDNNTIYIIL